MLVTAIVDDVSGECCDDDEKINNHDGEEADRNGNIAGVEEKRPNIQPHGCY